MLQTIAIKKKKGLKLDGVFDLSKLGIVLLILAAVIAIGFGIFSIAKGTANEGVVGVQDALGAMNESVFNDYNQKIVSGTQVVSAYNQMNGKPIAVIVKTCKGEWVNYNALVLPFQIISSPKDNSIPFVGIVKDASKQMVVSVSYFERVVAGNAEVNLSLTTPDKTLMFNHDIKEMLSPGNVNYITGTAKFTSYLIKDPGDTVIGIVFIQQGKHTNT